ncbi:MAG: SRPBCC family protein [Nitrososphaeraceae archaeon]
MKELKAEIIIHASMTKVWEIITLFDNYSNWNPIIQKIIGKPQLGENIEIHIHTVGGKNRIYHPIITKFDPPFELRWEGKFFLSSVLKGERIFKIIKLSENESKFINMEIFSGFGTKFTPKKMEQDILASFEKMNLSLKDFSESNNSN